MKLKRQMSGLLALLLILTSTSLTAFASGIQDGTGGDGTGAADGSTNNASTWSTSQQGYRFVIADQSFTPVSKSVDILFQLDGNVLTSEQYTNSRTTPLSTDVSNYHLFTKTWKKVVDDAKSDTDPTNDFTSAPPSAIGWTSSNQAIAQGLAFKDWFMGTDEYVGGVLPPISSGGGGGSNPKPPISGGASGGSGSLLVTATFKNGGHM